jgi:hypothetical protein
MGRVMVSIPLDGTLTLVGGLKLPGRGRPKPVLDESGRPLRGGISDKAFADINGVRQGMFIQSRDPAHPVVLFLHGGLPEYFLTERYPTGLENDFTMVWWEQRGAGLSYSSGIPAGNDDVGAVHSRHVVGD